VHLRCGRPLLGLFQLSDSPITLQHGIVQFGFAWNHTYKYYVIDVPSGGDLRISLGIISGDADMYVSVYDSTHPSNRPTMNNYTWMANAFGDDSLNITHGTYVCLPWSRTPVRGLILWHSFGFVCRPGYVSPATYIIGVYGFINSEFTIVALNSRIAMITVMDGVPVVRHVLPSCFRWQS
jgi:hypothetical protein